MSNMKNKIATYKLIDEDLLNKAIFHMEEVRCFYLDNEIQNELELSDDYNGVIYINELDDKWSQLNHELTIEQKFTITNPSVFFGEYGVTANENLIGLGVHVHSRTSSIQYKESVSHFGNSTSPIEIIYNHTFEKNELRGNIHIDFFLYLEDNIKSHSFQAKERGLILSDGLILSLELVVDGDGSIFPIREIHDKNEPLWTIEKNWADPIEDPFDVNHVAIKLNTAHSLFNQILEGKTRTSNYIMEDIIIESMAIIINDVINMEELRIEDYDNLEGNSILAIVKYWIVTFDVNVTDAFSIVNSLRRALK